MTWNVVVELAEGVSIRFPPVEEGEAYKVMDAMHSAYPDLEVGLEEK